MVLYFNCCNPKFQVYAGRDKEENEDLIKYGWPEDIWFHVDKLSSAHIYIRLPKGLTLQDVPKDVIHDCCQLVKNRSIEGCKAATVDVVFTPWTNLRKTADMATGQVGFHDTKLVTKIKAVKKDAETVKRIEKTCVEKFPDLRKLRDQRDYEERMDQKASEKKKREEEEQERKRKLKEDKIRSYEGVFTEDVMTSNTDINMTATEYEENFL